MAEWYSLWYECYSDMVLYVPHCLIPSSVAGHSGGFLCSGYCERLAVFLSVCVPHLFFPKSHMHCQYGWVWQCPGSAFITPGIAIPPLSLRSRWGSWPFRPNPLSSMVALSPGDSPSPLVLPSIDCPYLALVFLSPVSSFYFFPTKEALFLLIVKNKEVHAWW